MRRYNTHNELSFLNLCISSSRDAFKDLVKLKLIALDSNKFTALPGDLFRTLKEIETIYLSGNQITSLNRTLFWGLEKLTGLRLQWNGLSLIDG